MSMFPWNLVNDTVKMKVSNEAEALFELQSQLQLLQQLLSARVVWQKQYAGTCA